MRRERKKAIESPDLTKLRKVIVKKGLWVYIDYKKDPEVVKKRYLDHLERMAKSFLPESKD